MIWRKQWTIDLIIFNSFTYNILFSQQKMAIILFLNILDLLQLWNLQVSLSKKMKQNVISMQPSKFYI